MGGVLADPLGDSCYVYQFSAKYIFIEKLYLGQEMQRQSRDDACVFSASLNQMPGVSIKRNYHLQQCVFMYVNFAILFNNCLKYFCSTFNHFFFILLITSLCYFGRLNSI